MMIALNEISKAFNRQAQSYERAALVQREIGTRLFERLDYMLLSPQRILDLGCGSGYFSNLLQLKYPQAQVISLDLAFEMLLQTKKKHPQKSALVAADMHHLPFSEGLFDLIFANQVIHWGEEMGQIFRELNRVMSFNGCLMFTSLGPDTFKEIKQAWSGVDQFAHVNDFSDMHHIGDWLMMEQFLEPVVDMELLEVHYGSLRALMTALKRQGVRNIHPQRKKGLTSKASWSAFEQNYNTLKTEQGKFPLSYEVIYAQAWKGEQRQTDKGLETLIPFSKIKRF